MQKDQKSLPCGSESYLTKDILIIEEETEPCNCSKNTDVDAPPAQPCSCIPYTLLCCCGPINGISVIQPACQGLPDGTVVNNPAYAALLNRSFWTYKFMTDCNSTTRAISNFGIPICQLIIADNLIVREKIDGCGSYQPVQFTLDTNDPNLGPAPTGFQWVKVETSGRYEKGVCVEYQLEIVGDFPVTIQPIKVKAGTAILNFNCGCFQVPQCNPQGRLVLTKDCSNTIVNNQATLNYHITVNNIGDGILTNVQFNDVLTYPIMLSIGTITVSPSTLAVDTSVPGQIRISGNLGTLESGGQAVINYSIQIAGVLEPDVYTIFNMASASAAGTQTADSCSNTINAVLLDTQKCCIVDDTNTVTYRLKITSIGLSPDVLVDVIDNLSIPSGVVVQFTGFSGCTATFANTDVIVPLEVDITGPSQIRITCNSILIPNSGSVHRDIKFILVSSSVSGVVSIENTIQSVTPTNLSDQIFLGAGAIPIQVNIGVQLSLLCSNPCNGI